jgi:hypothetical protein
VVRHSVAVFCIYRKIRVPLRGTPPRSGGLL